MGFNSGFKGLIGQAVAAKVKKLLVSLCHSSFFVGIYSTFKETVLFPATYSSLPNKSKDITAITIN